MFKYFVKHIELIIEHAGDWWKNDIQTVMEDFLRTGGDPAISDALTINGQPGDLYNCSRPGSSYIPIFFLFFVLGQ